MMLLREIHVFELQIEMIFQCLILAVIDATWIIAGKNFSGLTRHSDCEVAI